MRVIRDIEYAAHGPQTSLDFYLAGGPGPLYVYFHDGGFIAGDKEDASAGLELLARQGISCISANYRLWRKGGSEQEPFFYGDAAAVVAWAARGAPQYGCTGPLYIGGSSAGAALAMMLCFARPLLEEQGVSAAAVAGWVFDAGQPTTHYELLARRGLDRRRVMVDETAPLYHLAGGPDAAQAAQRFLFVLAERDIPGRAEQNALLRATMLALGYAPGQLAWRTMQGQAHVGYLGSEGYWQQVAEFLLGR